MAAKRLRDGSDNDSVDEEREEKRQLRALPSFSTIIRKAMTANQLQKLWREMEPFFRTAVREEVEAAVIKALNPSTTHLLPQMQMQMQMQMQIEAANKASLQLVFGRPLSLPIFTNNRIEDSQNNPLQILLLHHNNAPPININISNIRVEVVVLHGDFPAQGHEDSWTSTEFDRAVVRAREGRRPLLTGDIHPTLREGGIAFINDLTVTDNSSWVKSQKFKIGARVLMSTYHGPRIMEAITDCFRVKDHRGESYKKHHPPALTDQVWRLERIGKDGAYRNRLSAENIRTVQDFLRLFNVDAPRLRSIIGMSDRAWESTIAHARTCLVDDYKVYTYRKQNWTIFLNSICNVIRIEMDGVPCSPHGLNLSHKTFVQEMVREAYQNWNVVEEFNAVQWHAALPQNEPIVLQGSIEASFGGSFDMDQLDQV